MFAKVASQVSASVQMHWHQINENWGSAISVLNLLSFENCRLDFYLQSLIHLSPITPTRRQRKSVAANSEPTAPPLRQASAARLLHVWQAFCLSAHAQGTFKKKTTKKIKQHCFLIISIILKRAHALALAIEIRALSSTVFEIFTSKVLKIKINKKKLFKIVIFDF